MNVEWRGTEAGQSIGAGLIVAQSVVSGVWSVVCGVWSVVCGVAQANLPPTSVPPLSVPSQTANKNFVPGPEICWKRWQDVRVRSSHSKVKSVQFCFDGETVGFLRNCCGLKICDLEFTVKIKPW